MSSGAFDFAWGVVKASLTESDKKHWGKPGQMMWWSDIYGGGLPDAVPYEWNTYTKGPLKGQPGPPRPKDQYWGGGGRDVVDFMDLHENRDLLHQLTGRPSDRNVTDYPVEGREIVPWSEIMANEGIPTSHGMSSAIEAVGGYGKSSKLEGISALDKPALTCKTKTCGACEACYAREHNMAGNSAQRRQFDIADKVLTDPVRVASALDESLFDSARKYARGKNEAAPIRFWGAGDSTDEGEYSMVTDVLNNQRPHELAGSSHWFSTRQYPALHDFFQGRNWAKDVFPENMHMKVSLPGHETRASMPQYKGKYADIIRDILSHPQISSTSYLDKDHKAEGMQICPASEPGNPSKCKEVMDSRTGEIGCSVCHSNMDVAYRHHGRKPSKEEPTKQEMNAMIANIRYGTEPEYRQTVRGRRVV